jgi:hypothetical protein
LVRAAAGFSLVFAALRRRLYLSFRWLYDEARELRRASELYGSRFGGLAHPFALFDQSWSGERLSTELCRHDSVDKRLGLALARF